MLDGSQVALGVRLLDMLGALPYVLPELCAMKGVTQSEPHTEDVWEHTLQVTQALEQLYGPLVGRYDEGAVADLTVGSAVLWLGRYREKLEAHYAHHLVPDRSPRALLFLGALFHDVGKPGTRVETVEGRVRFLEHPELGQKIMDTRARGLALSAAEVERLVTMVGQHMRVHFLAQPLQADGQDHPSRKAMYRFFQSSGPAGVDICLLSLADLRGTYGVTLPQDTWQVELQTCQALLEAYWEKSEEIVTPPRLLSGDDLMRIYDMEPGRQVGRLLAAIREGQAAGEITSRAEAEAFAARWIERSHLNHPPSGDEGDQ
jgi:hypothetical protein